MTQPTSPTLAVAQQAFQHFQNGLANGDWQPFIEMLTDDFSFWFPMGPYHGLNVGKERAAEFFRYVSETFEGGAHGDVRSHYINETTVVFEIRDEGWMGGKPYKNRVAVSFEVRGDQICAYREYFGSDGESN